MSYNIDSVDEIVLDASIEAKHVLKLLENENDLAEDNFLYEMQGAARAAIKEKDPKRLIPLLSFNWRGSWSGRGLDYLKDKIIPKIKGNVEAIFCWEGGDYVNGIVVKDGDYVECSVEQRLVKPEGW